MSLFLRTSGSEASQLAFKHLTRILREIEQYALHPSPRSPNKRSETADNLFEHSLFRQHSFTDCTRLVHQRR
jgi:hypothetical protein